MEQEELDNRFSYHSPDDRKMQLHQGIRFMVKAAAGLFDRHLPDSREKSLATAKLEEAMFWANAAIARHEVMSVEEYIGKHRKSDDE